MNISVNKGRALEQTVLKSQGNTLCLAKIPNGMKYTGGGESISLPNGKSRFLPRSVATKSPCDFMGVVISTQRAIVFDAKTCGLVKGFRIDHEPNFPKHQRDLIQRMGRAGALAGVLVEATEVGEFLWLDWEYLSPHGRCPWPVVPWELGVWRRLGATTSAIQFGRLVNP